MKSQSKTILISTIIFAILAIGVGFSVHKLKPAIQQDNSFVTPVTLEKQTFAKTSAVPKAGAMRPKGDYTKMILEYQGRMIQFDEQCHTFPSSAVFKTGTKIMLDNRGSEQRDIVIGTHHTSLPPYDFMIYTLSSAETLSISCGPLKNVATIISQ